MVDLMVDMELVEAYAGSQGLNSGEKTELGKRVLQKHGVSEEALDTTLSWYGRNLDEYAELFEKVDKEINKRRKKYAVKPDGLAANAENLWQYSEHLVLSELSGADSFSFNFPTSEIKNGEVLEFSFALPNATSLKSTLGVEYADGSGEGIVSNFSNKKSIKLSLSTDTSKKVSRIFGTLHLKEAKNLPFYIDSLQLTTQPFDSISYRSSRRNQKTFGPHIVKPAVKKMQKPIVWN